ncbi:unnamed protein product [Paramecium primaurelia]|uniref:Uncharacterized protein n=1 Tax=Paramecium primaurelia TaxID=5886 RepID=A0A8S1NNV2_PARPR|nr:unnamed protein product [Paramecium primaurelia]
MKQNSYFQQSQDFKCRDHPENLALFWCRSKDCNENRIFCLNCQKQNKHIQHYNEDVLSIHELTQFLINQSRLPKNLIEECQLQQQSTIKSFDKLISGLSYKFCGIEDKLNQFNHYQTQQALDSLIKFDEFKNHMKNNILGRLNKFQKILDDLFIKLELHLIQYQITDEQIEFNKQEQQKAI